VFDQREELPLLPFGNPIGFVSASRGGVNLKSTEQFDPPSDCSAYYLIFAQMVGVKWMLGSSYTPSALCPPQEAGLTSNIIMGTFRTGHEVETVVPGPVYQVISTTGFETQGPI
jgi:hypothetical protein